MIVLRLRPVGAEQAHAFREIVAVGRDQTAVAKTTEVFRREEAECTKFAEGARGSTAVLRAQRLRGILDDGESVIAREFQQRHHVRTLAEKMYGNDRLGTRSD